MNEMVETVRSGGVCRIVLNRPEKKNALTEAMYHRMATLLREADADPAIRVVQIESSGADFCAGNDIGDFIAHNRSAEPGSEPAALGFLEALVSFGKPIVAAVGGVAIGIGTTMLLHCDLVVAASDAVFGLPFVKLGLVPEGGSSLLLPRLIGPQRAAELLLLGDHFDGPTAHELRLVNRLVPSDQVRAEAYRLAQQLASRPPDAVRLSRQLLRGDPEELRAHMRQEAALFMQLLSSPEVVAGLEAFMSRSRPA